MIQWEVSRRDRNMTQEQDDSVGGEQVRQEHDTGKG